MTDSGRIKIAAFATAMFLAAMSIAGVIVHANKPATVTTTSIRPPAVVQTGLPGGRSHLPVTRQEQDQND